MIHLSFENIENLKLSHYAAVEDYVKSLQPIEQDSLYTQIKPILNLTEEARPLDDYMWLRNFILADVCALQEWVNNKSAYLKFDLFKKLYKNKFAKDPDTYIDSAKTYNAYTLLSNMGIRVCPYCEDEYIDIIHTEKGKRRTCDFDHFFPKGDDFYPALAMCFYNIIPSGKGCNQVMNTSSIEANPYHGDIELWSRFESCIPIGANLESLSIDQFKIKLNISGPMIQNNKTLAIEERYNHRPEEIKRYLLGAQNFSGSKIEEYLRLGLSKDWIESQKIQTLGNPYPHDRGRVLHQKLKFDLTGY